MNGVSSHDGGANGGIERIGGSFLVSSGAYSSWLGSIMLNQQNSSAMEYLFPSSIESTSSDHTAGIEAIIAEPDNTTYRRMFADLMMESADPVRERIGQAMHAMLDVPELKLVVEVGINGALVFDVLHPQTLNAHYDSGRLIHTIFRKISQTDYLRRMPTGTKYVFCCGWLEEIHLVNTPLSMDSGYLICIRKLITSCPIRAIVPNDFEMSPVAIRQSDGKFIWSWMGLPDYLRQWVSHPHGDGVSRVNTVYDSKESGINGLTQAFIRAAKRSLSSNHARYGAAL